MSENKEVLRGLYPFMDAKLSEPSKTAGKTGDFEQPAAEFGVSDEVLAESIRQKAQESIEVKQRYFESQADKLVQAAKAIAQVYRNEGKMFTMGNGGSNCDASHLAVEFLHPVTAGRPALPAINLGADVTLITAASNDLGFENAFVRQLIAQARKDDVLIGFSTSGCSDNLMAAFRKAKELGLTTIGFAGMDGGDMAKIVEVDICMVVETMSIHRIQESHLTTYHILWDLVHALLADDRKKQVGR